MHCACQSSLCYAWSNFVCLCVWSDFFHKVILRLDWGFIWKILWEYIFFWLHERMFSLIKLSQNMRLLLKRFTVTLCNFIHYWSNLLKSSAFTDKWKYSGLSLFLRKKKREREREKEKKLYYHFTFKGNLFFLRMKVSEIHLLLWKWRKLRSLTMNIL